MTITEWIEALESGKFKQIRGKLKDNRGYCCLGVACELAGVEWRVPGYIASYKGAEEYAQLPSALREELGLTNNQVQKLIGFNDRQQDSFLEIAAKLREWFPQ